MGICNDDKKGFTKIILKIETFFNYIIKLLKFIAREFYSIDSFCRICGKDIHDFNVSDDLWRKVSYKHNHGGLMCYDCFCEKSSEMDLPCCWKLEKPL